MTPRPPTQSAAPLAPLSYRGGPTRDERRYGRADRAVFVGSALPAGANLALAGSVYVLDARGRGGLDVETAWVIATWAIFGIYTTLWLVGQYLFWRERDDLPPVSAFALACVAAFGLLSFLLNFVYTNVVLP